MKELSKEDILAAMDCQVQELDVPEWGGKVYFRPMSGAERDSFDAAVMAAKESGKMPGRAEIAYRVLCDKDGNRIFTAADVAALGAKSGAALDRIVAKSMRASFLGDSGVDIAAGN